MRWLDGITESMDMSLGELCELVPAWHGEQNRVLPPDSTGGLTLFRPLSWLQPQVQNMGKGVSLETGDV